MRVPLSQVPWEKLVVGQKLESLRGCPGFITELDESDDQTVVIGWDHSACTNHPALNEHGWYMVGPSRYISNTSAVYHGQAKVLFVDTLEINE